MRKMLIACAFLPLSAFSQTQTNIVPNPGFEEYKQLPCACMQNDMGDYLNNWSAANGGTSDYITDLANAGCYADCKANGGQGMQAPHGGHGMVFFYNYYPSGNYREYVAVNLKTPLIKGKKYYAEMYVSLTDHSRTASNNVGMNFSVGKPMSDKYVINANPQVNETNVITDSKGWVKVSGTFFAAEAYTYLTIGNFFSLEGTKHQSTVAGDNSGGSGFAGYYVDDVVVMQAESNLAVTGDTLVMSGAFAKLNATGSKSYSWADYSKPKVIIGSGAEIKVQMKTKKTFIVYGDNGESELITVNVTAGPVFMQSLSGRKVKKGSTVKVHNEKIKITVYDNNKIDGDSISLYYGDSCIVNNIQLTKKKKTFTITIDKTQPKQLILYANNLGSQPPNTAACIIGDGKNEINVVLSSDLKASDAVMLVYEEEK
jgi:hypothetical protein